MIGIYSNIFDSLEATIERARLYRGQSRFYWSLPRQIGASTWILEQIKKDIKAGRVVILAGLPHIRSDVRNNLELNEATKNKQLVVITTASSKILSGSRVDRVYGDNIKYWSSADQLEFMACVEPCLREDGYAVFINTTEGEP